MFPRGFKSKPVASGFGLASAAGAPEMPIQRELCSLALSDAKHDFGPVYIPYAKNIVPDIAECKEDTENNYMKNTLGIDIVSRTKGGNNIQHFAFTGGALLDDKYTSPYIANEYKYTYKHRHIDGTRDKLYNALNGLGINKVFFIIDINSGYFNDEIEIKHNDMQYIILENKQTLYDPANKINGESKIIKDARNNVFFSREKDNAFEYYPSWDKYMHGEQLNANGLFYCNHDIYQKLLTQKNKSIGISIMNDSERNKLVIMESSFAEKNAGIEKSLNINQIYKQYNITIQELIDELKIPSRSIMPINYINEYHCIAKRLGDQGQALSCLKPTYNLEYKKIGRDFEPLISNGNHCFVTKDKLAFSAAIIYGVPMAIYCHTVAQPGIETMELFIREDILNPEVIKASLRNRYTQLYKDYKKSIKDVKTKHVAYLKEYEKLSIHKLPEYIDSLTKVATEKQFKTIITQLYELSTKLLLISEKIKDSDTMKILFDDDAENITELPQLKKNELSKMNAEELYKIILELTNKHGLYISIVTDLLNLVSMAKNARTSFIDDDTNILISSMNPFFTGSASRIMYSTVEANVNPMIEKYTSAGLLSTIYNRISSTDQILADRFFENIMNIYKGNSTYGIIFSEYISRIIKGNEIGGGSSSSGWSAASAAEIKPKKKPSKSHMAIFAGKKRRGVPSNEGEVQEYVLPNQQSEPISEDYISTLVNKNGTTVKRQKPSGGANDILINNFYMCALLQLYIVTKVTDVKTNLDDDMMEEIFNYLMKSNANSNNNKNSNKNKPTDYILFDSMNPYDIIMKSDAQLYNINEKIKMNKGLVEIPEEIIYYAEKGLEDIKMAYNTPNVLNKTRKALPNAYRNWKKGLLNIGAPNFAKMSGNTNTRKLGEIKFKMPLQINKKVSAFPKVSLASVPKTFRRIPIQTFKPNPLFATAAKGVRLATQATKKLVGGRGRITKNKRSRNHKSRKDTKKRHWLLN